MKPEKILIVGGGAAGWMAANLMANAWSTCGISITVIESVKIGTVGVGEGSTPFLRDFFRKLNIAESEWMPACNATFKNGIRFPGWSATEKSYFHPFYVEGDAQAAIQFFKNSYARRMGYNINAHPDAYFLTTQIANQYRAPILSDGTTHATDYGYHFDSELLGEFLKKKALEAGVSHIDDKVVSVAVGEDGSIRSVLAENSGTHVADLFVDCSGFKGLLIQDALGEPLCSVKSRLFNDAAIAVQTPLSEKQALFSGPLMSETRSSALSNGWVWQIPLANRFGNGYVYSSAYVSDDEARKELCTFLGINEQDHDFRQLRWEPGRISQHWKANCVAIGLSQGFLEPLEAPMLRIIQSTCESFIAAFEEGSFSTAKRSEFNREVNQLIDGTVDYLQAHYKASSRTDSLYWQASRENDVVSPVLARLLEAWNSTLSFDDVLHEVRDALTYHKTSWYCLFAGKGCFGEAEKAVPAHVEEQRLRIMQMLDDAASRYQDHWGAIQTIEQSKSKPA